MTEMEIALHAVKVSDLKRQWDAACRKFDHYGTLPALLDMQAAKNRLIAAEDELVGEYDPYAARNVRPFDAEQQDHDDNLYPWRN